MARFPRLILRLHHRLDAIPLQQLLMPLPTLWHLLLPLLWEIRAHRPTQPHPVVPRDEHEIGVRGLVADKVGLAGFGQLGVDNAEHAADLGAVAVDGGLDAFLGVKLEVQDIR